MNVLTLGNVFFILQVGKLLEPLWGNIEMVTFFIIVNTGVAVFSSILYYFLYMVTFNTDHLFQTHIHGEIIILLSYYDILLVHE